jgi:murein peptide amidase A
MSTVRHILAAGLTLLLMIIGGAWGCSSSGPRHRHDHANAPQIGWTTIGLSLESAPIEASTIGSGPFRVMIVGGIHGNEQEAAPALDLLAERLHQHSAHATIRFIRDINPDGSAAGTRGNARGVDINRNWPTRCFRPLRAHGRTPASEPETALLLQEIESFAPDVIVVLHSISSGPFVNYDGPATHLAERFAAAAQASDSRWHVRPSMGYPTPGSLGNWAGVERDIPILTIEFERGHDPALVPPALISGILSLLQPQDWFPDLRS